MAQAQESIRKMQEQVDEIRQTQDPQERQRLLEEHWCTLQVTMSMMFGMWGPGMMASRGREDNYSQLGPEQQRQRQYMNDQYVALQQMMMNQLKQHQQWLDAAPAKEASADAGRRLYESVCIAYHGPGFAGAPRLGDKAAWALRIQQGGAMLYEHALSGFRMMPPKGGSMATDDEVKAAVDYMVAAAK